MLSLSRVAADLPIPEPIPNFVALGALPLLEPDAFVLPALELDDFSLGLPFLSGEFSPPSPKEQFIHVPNGFVTGSFFFAAFFGTGDLLGLFPFRDTVVFLTDFMKLDTLAVGEEAFWGEEAFLLGVERLRARERTGGSSESECEER